MPRSTAWRIAATAAPSSCAPHDDAHPAPPIAHEPKPTRVIDGPERPSCRVGTTLFGLTRAAHRRAAARHRALSLHVLPVPGEVALQAIDLVARHADPVKLVRVDDQLRRDPDAAQRLVHLLAPHR